jgi:hypothetical protein
VVDYRSDDGPFTLAATADITLTPGATYGNTTLTASDSFFKGTHVGALFRLTHETVVQTCALGAQDEVTATIRVVGIKTATHNDRVFGIDVAGTFVGTLQVQRSFDSETTGFSDYDPASATITAPGSTTFSGDDNDNSITWYRVKMKAYTSGSAVVTLSYEQDSGSGVCRVTGVVSSTVANVEVLSDFRNVAATKSWLEGEWSDRRGYPTAIAFFDGRLWWSRDDRFWGSVSGDYFGYSLDVTGDSGSIQRDISTGGDLAQVYWLLPLQRLIFGTAGEQDSGRSSSFDEPLTPTNLTLKTASTRGASNISPLKVDTRGIFVGRSGKQMYELFFDLDVNDYQAASITRQHEDLALSAAPEEYGDGFVELCLQREPENYIWGIREDGQVATMIYEPKEKVAGWFRVLTGRYGSCATNGDRIISMCMLPSTDEDLIYLNVERNVMINGTRSKLYCIEKLKRHIDATTRYSGSIVQNGLYMMDSFITAEADETTTQTISGLDHLIGNAVMAVGKKLGQTYYSPSTSVYIVDDNGEIELNEAFTGTIAVGRPYEGRYLSSKEAYGGENGTAIGGTKRIAAISLQLLQTHYDALRMGRGVDPILDDRFDDRGVRFGGTAYATRGAGLTGAADSKKATISFWIRRHAGTGGRILAGATSVGGGGSHTRFALGTGTNRFSFVLNNAADSAICDLRSSPIPTGRWVHVIASVDLSDTGKRHIYVDDVSDLSQVTTYTNDTADFTLADWGIGALASGASVISADIADLWFMPGFYLDLSDEANRRLFTDYDYDVDESGRLIPVDLGSDGSAPTGTAPLVYLSGAASAWHQNKGTGGGFTLNGMLSASLSLPVEDPDMDELPRLKEDGTPVDVTQPFDLKIDQTKFPFPGEWDADVRLGLKVRPGYSAILSSIVMDIETNP